MDAGWPHEGLDVDALMGAGWKPTAFRQFILKVHSRCNLACDYCYVYTSPDQSWRRRPSRMSRDTATRAVERLPLGPFFAVSGLLLCGLAISFAGAGMYELVAAGYLPPRPVAFPEIPWMGIHPDLSALLVQLTIVTVIAGAGIMTLTRKPEPEPPGTR